jgi:hypothetical protein
MAAQPTLLNSCAWAATAAEARYRINAKPQLARQSRIVALDSGASAVIRPLVAMPWRGARFLTYEPERADAVSATRDEFADIVLTRLDGSHVRLSDEMTGVDFVMMVATANGGVIAASTIGNACTLRGIMTAGVVLGTGRAVDAAVTALRPHARVLLVSNDVQDVAEIMSAVAS